MKIISYKKIILILMCMSMLSLLGCTDNKILKSNKNQVSNKVHKINNKISNFLGFPIYLDPRAGKVAYSTITEDDYFIYYCSENGINRVDKKTGEYKLILKCKNTGNLILSDRYIFFVVENGSKDCCILRVDKDGKNLLKLVDKKNVPERGYCIELSLYDDEIYIRVIGKVYSFNMSSYNIRLLCEDADSFQIHNGYMYYIDHGEKTFTIYKRNLNNLKDQIFLGKGISMPQSDIYDNFLWAGGDLYYSTRVPWKIHKYSEGKSVLINSTKNNYVSDIVEYKGQAYFVISDGDDTYRIKKYSSKDNAVFEVAELKDYYGGLRMVNGYAYYYGKDYKNQYIKLNE